MDFLSRFYQTGIRRFLPNLLTYFLLISLLTCIVSPHPDLILKTGISSLLGLSNIYLVRLSNEYFNQLNPFTNTWSISVLTQFYLFFPFIIWFSGYGNNTKNGERNLFIFLTILCITSLLSFLYFYDKFPLTIYFFTFTRLWEIALGALIFIVFQKKIKIVQSIKKIPPVIPSIFICCMIFIPLTYSKISTFLVIIITSILIACLRDNTFIFKFFIKKEVIFLGLISYSLYLWQWGILSLSKWVINIEKWWIMAIQLFIIFLISLASYKLIEVPTMRENWFLERKNINYPFILILILNLIITPPTSRSISILTKPFNGELYKGKFEKDQFIYIQENMECDLFSKSRTIKPLNCISGNHEKNIIYLFGDSHASNLVNSIEFAKNKNNYHYFKYLTNGWNNTVLGENWHESNKIFRILENLSSDDLIVWSSANYESKNVEKTLLVKSQIEYLVKISKLTGVPVLLIDDLPSFEYSDFYSTTFANKTFKKLSIEQVIQERADHTFLLKNASNKNKKIFYLDPLSSVCKNDFCSPIINGKLIYADNSPHFNKYGSKLLSDALSKNIKLIKSN